MTSTADDPDDVEIHPQYEVAMHIEELFSVPLYRNPEDPLIERWREVGERLRALGVRHLDEGVEAASAFLQAKLEARRERRRREKLRRARARARARSSAGASAGAAAESDAGSDAAASAPASA